MTAEYPEADVSVRWLKEKSQLSAALRLNRYSPGEVTKIAKYNAKHYIARIRIRKREKRGQMSFAEAKPVLLNEAAKMENRRFLKENDGAALFIFRGKPYSLGEFRREFQELSHDEQARYVTFDQLKGLLNKLIDRTVLVEKAEKELKKSEVDLLRKADLKIYDYTILNMIEENKRTDKK